MNWSARQGETPPAQARLSQFSSAGYEEPEAELPLLGSLQGGVAGRETLAGRESPESSHNTGCGRGLSAAAHRRWSFRQWEALGRRQASASAPQDGCGGGVRQAAAVCSDSDKNAVPGNVHAGWPLPLNLP